MIIAVDGPTASGKGTIARRLAEHYGLKRLDTGSLYRAVGLAVLDAGGDPADEKAAVAAAEALDLSAIDERRIRSSAAGLGRLAWWPTFRPSARVLRKAQRAFAADPARRGARRARHRHRDLPGRPGEALRHRRSLPVRTERRLEELQAGARRSASRSCRPRSPNGTRGT